MTAQQLQVAPPFARCDRCGLLFLNVPHDRHYASLECRMVAARLDAGRRGLGRLDAGRRKLLGRVGITVEMLETEVETSRPNGAAMPPQQPVKRLVAVAWAPRGAVAIARANLAGDLAPLAVRERWLAEYAADPSMRERLDALPPYELGRKAEELMQTSMGKEGVERHAKQCRGRTWQRVMAWRRREAVGK